MLGYLWPFRFIASKKALPGPLNTHIGGILVETVILRLVIMEETH